MNIEDELHKETDAIRSRLKRQIEQSILDKAADDIAMEKLILAVETAFERAFKKLSWFSFKAFAWIVFTGVVVLALKVTGWTHE